MKIMKLLVRKGANVNAINIEGRTALHLVSAEGYFKGAKFLIENGANVNAEDYNGWTALYLASSWGYDLKLIKLLIEKGANIEAKNCEGETPLDIVKKDPNKNLIELFENFQKKDK